MGRLTQWFGRTYVGLFNARHSRSGILWEGRHTACMAIAKMTSCAATARADK